MPLARPLQTIAATMLAVSAGLTGFAAWVALRECPIPEHARMLCRDNLAPVTDPTPFCCDAVNDPAPVLSLAILAAAIPAIVLAFRHVQGRIWPDGAECRLRRDFRPAESISDKSGMAGRGTLAALYGALFASQAKGR